MILSKAENINEPCFKNVDFLNRTLSPSCVGQLQYIRLAQPVSGAQVVQGQIQTLANTQQVSVTTVNIYIYIFNFNNNINITY